MRIVAGAIPTGRDFYEGRRALVDHLKDCLQGSDVLMLGPRRTGKTSVIKEYLATEEAASEEFRYVFIDLESTKNLYEFYLRIIKEILSASNKWAGLVRFSVDGMKTLSNKLGEIFDNGIEIKDYLGGVSGTALRIKFPKFEPEKVEALSKELQRLLANIDRQLVIVLDEFPEMIWKLGLDSEDPKEQQLEQRKQQTELLLAGLRTVRQEGAAKNHRVIVAGSVNLDNTLIHLQLGNLLNDIKRITVPYLTTDQSVELMSLLGSGQGFTYSSENLMRDFVRRQFGRCTPFYIQIYAEALLQMKLAGQVAGAFTEDDLKKAYRAVLDNARGPRYLLDRIKKYYSKEEQTQVHLILGSLAKQQFKQTGRLCDNDCEKILTSVDSSIVRHQVVELLAKMRSDDLIQHSNDGSCFEFESQLLCNFWHYQLVAAEFLV